jgi:hypothetical protein
VTSKDASAEARETMTPASAARVSPNFASRVLTRHPCWTSTLATDSWDDLARLAHGRFDVTAPLLQRRRRPIPGTDLPFPGRVKFYRFDPDTSHRHHRTVLPYEPASGTVPLIVIARIVV